MKLLAMVHELSRIWKSRDFFSQKFWNIEYKATGATLPRDLYFHLLEMPESVHELDIVRLMYDDDPKKYTHANKTASRLWDIIINSLLTMDVEKKFHTENNRIQFSVSRDAFVAKSLFHLGAKGTAFHVANKALDDALEYQFHDSAISLQSTVALIHASHGDVKGITKAKEEIRRLTALMLVELEAEMLSFEYIAKLQSMTSRRSRMITEAVESVLEQLKAMEADHASHKIKSAYFDLASKYYMVIENFEASNTICDDMLDYLKANPKFSSPRAELNIYTTKLANYMHLLQYEKGDEIITHVQEKYSDILPLKAAFAHYAMLYRMRQTKYEEARTYCELILNHNNFKALHPMVIADTYAVAQYLQFFMPKALLKESPISKVSYEMYTEKAKVYEDDKKGINATFRFLKFLHSIRNENLNDVVAEAENLMKYHVRNFTTRENLRSSSVIKMINELATHNFDTSRIRISVLSKFMINLIDTKNDPVAMNDPSEIIPFEALWDLVINLVVEHNHGLLRPVRKRKKTEPGMPKEPKFVFSAEQLRVIAAYVSYGKRSRGRPRHFATVEELHQYEMEQQKQLTGS